MLHAGLKLCFLSVSRFGAVYVTDPLLSASVGGTPLVRLKKVVPDGCGTVWLKLESGNPTGSYKDRMAVAVLGRAIKRGEVKPGDRVVDIFGSGGYYSELLATVVGDAGEAVLHNNPGFEAWGINGLTDRFDGRDPGNIIRHTRSGINLDLGEGTIDAALIVMAFHDLYVVPTRYDGERYVPVGNPANVVYFLEQVLVALKPGGRFVVVDHDGNNESDNLMVSELHRIKESFAKEEIGSRGFTFLTSSDALKGAGDDLDRIVFDEDIQGKTDRFILVFEKP